MHSHMVPSDSNLLIAVLYEQNFDTLDSMYLVPPHRREEKKNKQIKWTQNFEFDWFKIRFLNVKAHGT